MKVLSFLLLNGLLLLTYGRRPGLPPAVQSPSFASPKERNPRKGDPTGRVPSLRCGQPVVLTHGAVPSNSLCSLRSRRSNNAGKLEHEAEASCSASARPIRCAPRHGQRGGEPCSGHCCARPANQRASLSCPFPHWGKAGMGAGVPQRPPKRPHLYPPPKGEGVKTTANGCSCAAWPRATSAPKSARPCPT